MYLYSSNMKKWWWRSWGNKNSSCILKWHSVYRSICDLTLSPSRWGDVLSSSGWGRCPQSGCAGVPVSRCAFCTEPAAPPLPPLPLVPRVTGPLWQTRLQTETHIVVFGIIFRFGGCCVSWERRKQRLLWSVEEELLLLLPPFAPWWGFFSFLHRSADCCDCVTTYGFFIYFSAWLTHSKCQQRYKEL